MAVTKLFVMQKKLKKTNVFKRIKEPYTSNNLVLALFCICIFFIKNMYCIFCIGHQMAETKLFVMRNLKNKCF